MKKYLMLALALAITASGLEAKNSPGRQLREAVKKNNFAETNLLIKQGVYIEAQDEHGNTPLILAIQKGSLEMVSLLLRYGASVKTPNNYGETAWTWARYQLDKAMHSLEEIETEYDTHPCNNVDARNYATDRDIEETRQFFKSKIRNCKNSIKNYKKIFNKTVLYC